MIFKFKIGKYLYDVDIEEQDGLFTFSFGYNPDIIAEIKTLEKRKWNPEDKCWTAPNTPRNNFILKYLTGGNPFADYDKALVVIDNFERPLREHQKEMVAHELTRKACIISGEMGTGKTLAYIEAMERSGHDDWFFIAPRAAIKAVERELKLWNSKVRPRLLTYEGLVKVMDQWPAGQPAPRGVIFDEAQKIKTPSALRSRAAAALTTGMRKDHGGDCYIILGSGTCAPRSPADWWHLCEVACPGYLKESSIFDFQKRVGIIAEKENSAAGGVYNHLLSWRDNPDKCDICGEFQTQHDALTEHDFKPSKNEVAFLYERMKGLVLVKLKKDCLELPDKIYKPIILEPTSETLRVGKLLKRTAKNAITALTLLRELSDGFQYYDRDTGESEVCDVCIGAGRYQHHPDEDAEVCPKCRGTGKTAILVRDVRVVATPKEQALIDLLEEHEDVGRLVTFAAFTGSVDRCVGICHRQDWSVVRLDGTGWSVTDPKGQPIAGDPLDIFQDKLVDLPRVCFVGNADSAGVGLTLTASPSIVYYSNSFNAESRMQSEDRIHRMGMDLNRGATIYDLIHLPTDQLILDNLKLKKNLLNISLGELEID